MINLIEKVLNDEVLYWMYMGIALLWFLTGRIEESTLLVAILFWGRGVRK